MVIREWRPTQSNSLLVGDDPVPIQGPAGGQGGCDGHAGANRSVVSDVTMHLPLNKPLQLPGKRDSTTDGARSCILEVRLRSEERRVGKECRYRWWVYA